MCQRLNHGWQCTRQTPFLLSDSSSPESIRLFKGGLFSLMVSTVSSNKNKKSLKRNAVVHNPLATILNSSNLFQSKKYVSCLKIQIIIKCNLKVLVSKCYFCLFNVISHHLITRKWMCLNTGHCYHRYYIMYIMCSNITLSASKNGKFKY